MDRHPIRQAALRERVVFGGAVLGTAVIPHEDIPHLSVMPIEEGRLGDELRQCLHEWHSLILRHAHDAYTCTGPDVQGFPSGHGMGPDDRMPNIREMVDSRGSVTAWSILLSPSPMHRPQALEALLPCGWEGIVSGRRADEERVAQHVAQRVTLRIHRHFHRIEERAAGGRRRVRQIGMPGQSGIGVPNGTPLSIHDI